MKKIILVCSLISLTNIKTSLDKPLPKNIKDILEQKSKEKKEIETATYEELKQKIDKNHEDAKKFIEEYNKKMSELASQIVPAEETKSEKQKKITLEKKIIEVIKYYVNLPLPTYTWKRIMDVAENFKELTLEELSEKKQEDIAKKLLNIANIASKNVLNQTYISYKNASIATLNFDTYSYDELNAFLTIIDEISKVEYVKTPSSLIIYENKINEVLKFIKNNLFNDISMMKSNFAGLPLNKLVKNHEPKLLDNVPIIPFDTIILLAKVLVHITQNKELKNALQVLMIKQRQNTLTQQNEEILLDVQDTLNAFFKIKFLNEYNFNYYGNIKKLFTSFIDTFKRNINQAEYSIEQSFLGGFIEKVNSTKKTNDLMENATKATLIKIYESALHMIFLCGFKIPNKYYITKEMSIIEICSMFLQLQNDIEFSLSAIDKDPENNINSYKSQANNIQKLFANVYLKLKTIDDPLYHVKYDTDELIKIHFIDEYYTPGTDSYNTFSDFTPDDLKLLFESDTSIIDNLKNEKVPIERLDKQDLKLLYALVYKWWNVFDRHSNIVLKKKVSDMPSFDELNDYNIKQRGKESKLDSFLKEINLTSNKNIPSFQSKSNEQTIQSESTITSEKQPQSWFSYFASWLNPWEWYTWYYGIQE